MTTDEQNPEALRVKLGDALLADLVNAAKRRKAPVIRHKLRVYPDGRIDRVPDGELTFCEYCEEAVKDEDLAKWRTENSFFSFDELNAHLKEAHPKAPLLKNRW